MLKFIFPVQSILFKTIILTVRRLHVLTLAVSDKSLLSLPR